MLRPISLLCILVPAVAFRPLHRPAAILRPVPPLPPLLLHRHIDSPRAASPLRLGRLDSQWRSSLAGLKSSPLQFFSIPLVAGLVGYITNWVGVKMLFYPTRWLGIPIVRVPGQPLGLLGWQGIVPAKRVAMASKLGTAPLQLRPHRNSNAVDVTISRLISVREVFGRLEAHRLAALLQPTVNPVVFGGYLPSPLTFPFLLSSARDLIRNIESVVDIRSLVISGLTTDPRTLGQFFQKVGRKELQFLVDSGFGIGVVLGKSHFFKTSSAIPTFPGLFQMILWMLYPANWTLPVGGAVVGYITNWIALKWIFEPIEPTKVGPFLLQGMFLKRQREVSEDFSGYIADRVLNSRRVWESMLSEDREGRFFSILRRNVPLFSSQISQIMQELRQKVGSSANHAIHRYTDDKLRLKATLIEKMKKLSPKEFEQVKLFSPHSNQFIFSS